MNCFAPTGGVDDPPATNSITLRAGAFAYPQHYEPYTVKLSFLDPLLTIKRSGQRSKKRLTRGPPDLPEGTPWVKVEESASHPTLPVGREPRGVGFLMEKCDEIC